MAHCIIKVCKPANAFYTNIFSTVFIYTTARSMERIISRNIEHPISAMNTCAEPQFIIFNQWKNFFIGDGVNITYN